MKLVQLNAWGGRVDNVLGDFLEDQKPDIFCGQEIISYKDGDSILFMPLEEMQKIIEAKYSVFGACASFSFMESHASFGNAVLSKIPIVSSETVFTNLEYVKNFSFTEHDYNIRNFVHAVIDCEGKKLNVLTHHGHHVSGHKNGTTETDKQMKMLANYISGLDGPIILTGDFNLQPKSQSLLELNEKLNNLSVEYELTTTRNLLTNKTEVCDYVFTSDEIKVINFYMPENIVSDHQALVLEFDL